MVEVDEHKIHAVIQTYVRKLKPETYMEAKGIKYALIELGLVTEQELNEATGDLVARRFQ